MHVDYVDEYSVAARRARTIDVVVYDGVTGDNVDDIMT